MNEAFTRVTGYNREDVFDQSHESVLRARIEDQGFFRDMNETLGSGGTFDNTSLFRKKDGTIYVQRTKIIPLTTEDEQRPYYVTFGEDITRQQGDESKIAAQSLKIDELGQKLQTLERDQRLELLGQMLGSTAHDFNNFLSVINGMSQLLEGQLNHDDPRHKMVNLIRQSGAKATELVKQLLVFSRKGALTSDVLNVYDELNGMRQLLEMVATKQVPLSLESKLVSPQVNINKGHLGQIVVNLVSNARDAILSAPNRAPAISITISPAILYINYVHDGGIIPAGDYVVIQVSDNGPGIDPALVKKIFLPFFTTKTEEKGTGLGLATVASLTEQAHGHILVQSDLGKGTVFSIFLPVDKQ